MDCSKCSSRPLRQIQRSLGPDVWFCDECGGAWVPDGGPFDAALPAAILDASVGASETELDRLAGVCPLGHGILTRAQTFVGRGFYLDRCATCSGVWFDRGEWQSVSVAGLAAGMYIIWTEPWQRGQREQIAASAYEQQLQKALGYELVDRIAELAAEMRDHPHRNLALGFLHAELGRDK
jgi:Zn-finger nucleic acid-binding protein